MDRIITMKDFRRNTSVESDNDMSGDEYNDTLQDLVYLANKEGRLVKGVFESAHVLEICPEIVDVCILPGGPNENIATHIQHKLIEAYCWENDIKIVETDTIYCTNNQRSKSMDCNGIDCILITSKPYREELEADDASNEFLENFG